MVAIAFVLVLFAADVLPALVAISIVLVVGVAFGATYVRLDSSRR